jgi:cell wall-associated NlpC family hydrolase
MTGLRFLRFAVLALASLALAVPAAAQPAAGATARARDATRASARRPLASLGARGANPSGPFARLTAPQRDSIIENSRSLLGVRYRWAGAVPERGLDCSGLVQYVFAKLGIALPHSSRELAKVGAVVERDTAQMQPGDLLVFSKKSSRRISHVAIYIGAGKMIHASSGAGRVVETPVMEYRGALLRGVRRVVALDSTGGEASFASMGIKN